MTMADFFQLHWEEFKWFIGALFCLLLILGMGGAFD